MNEMFTFQEFSKHNPLETIPTTYSGIFHAPFLDSVSFQRQKGETCAPTSFRVVLNSQGIQKAYGIPLQENRRMVSVFHAHGLIEVEKDGVFMNEVLDVANHFPNLKKDIDIKKIPVAKFIARDDRVRKIWIRELIDRRSILASVNAQKFYNATPKEIDPDMGHAIAILGIDIPSPSEMKDRNPRFLIFDPNTTQQEWIDTDEIFECLSKHSIHLSFGRVD